MAANDAKTMSTAETLYRERTPKSKKMFDEVSRLIPGGVTGTGFLHPYPSYIVRANGCYLYDVDGNRLTDFMNGSFVLPLGHNHPKVRQAIREQMKNGMFFTFPSIVEQDLAREIIDRVPSIEKVRFSVSGTEATMYATRLARAFTGRTKVAKVVGGYHGTHDGLWIGVGRAAGTGDISVPAGVLPEARDELVFMEFNDTEGSVAAIEGEKDNLAAVIIEPIMGAGGLIPPAPGYLEALRDVTARHDIVLVFDEMISFSIARGGAQEFYGVTPDMTTTGKCAGGGLPIGVFGGRAEIMDLLDPTKTSTGYAKVSHVATYGGHPLSMVSGLAYLQAMTPEVYARLHHLGDLVRSELRHLFARLEAPIQVTGVGHLFGFHWTVQDVTDYATASSSDRDTIHDICLAMISKGYFPSSGARCCVSAAMTERHIRGFVRAMEETLHELDLVS
ncbi:MAG: aspartate aminotransferase family protein [Chloroflexi bacterium]|nr:aspartate aminotransferase family protein [Chloroflexota bacterium]MCH8284367.1 aspartate aminotransferase family protein [Chloroflexota bacterium]